MMNAYQELPPQTVFHACARGLKQYDRDRLTTVNHGGTEAAVKFATAVFAGKPVDAMMAVEVVEAHRTLDMLPRSVDGEPKPVRLSRLLWGGDDAPDWAARIIDQHRASSAPAQLDPFAPLPPAPGQPPQQQAPAVEPVAASVRDDIAAANDALAGVAGDLIAIDQMTVEALRAAFWVSYRSALRSLTRSARAKTSRRVPVADQAAAGLEGNALNEIRDLIASEPITGWRHLPDTLAAAIDVDFDQALDGSLQDFEETALAIILASQADAARRVSDRIGVDPLIVQGVAASPDLAQAAATGLRSSLHDWIRTQFARRDVSPSLRDEDLFATPRQMFMRALRTASGAGSGSDVDSVGADLASRVINMVRSGRASSRVLSPVIDRVLVEESYWHYGDPSTRRQPYEPHIALAEKSWVDDEERGREIGNARPGEHHENCQCQILPRWRLRI